MAVQEEVVVSPPPAARAGQRVAGRQGQHWKNGLYLVPTSDVDGRRRWETIILLLSKKAQVQEFVKLQAAVKQARRGETEP